MGNFPDEQIAYRISFISTEYYKGNFEESISSLIPGKEM